MLEKYINTCHHYSNKNPAYADYSAFREEIETDPKVPDCVRITKFKNIFSNPYTVTEM